MSNTDDRLDFTAVRWATARAMRRIVEDESLDANTRIDASHELMRILERIDPDERVVVAALRRERDDLERELRYLDPDLEGKLKCGFGGPVPIDCEEFPYA